MNSNDIKQAPFNTTLMSSVKAAYEYFGGTKRSDSMLFGLTGHAFVINITNGLGPCAPYLWDFEPFDKLCQSSLGLSIYDDEGFVLEKTEEEGKKTASKAIKAILDDGDLVLLSSLEYQLITGYDDEFFHVTEPWKGGPSVTPNLKKETLEGIKQFLTFTRISKVDTTKLDTCIKQSIEYAISLLEKPSSTPDNAMGSKAYDFWLEKITDENAVGQGNWWTSNVWSECRRMASEYMIELKVHFDADTLLDTLSERYKTSSELLKMIADRDTNKEKTIQLIKQLQNNEQSTYPLLKKLIE